MAAREERLVREGLVRKAEDGLARTPDAAPTDEMLDLHTVLAAIVRGGDAVDLNDRLRLVFDRFEIDTLPAGKFAVLSYLRDDLVDRYGDQDGYLRVITSSGVSHTLSDAPPSAGPLIVLDEPSAASPNACASSATSSWAGDWPSGRLGGAKRAQLGIAPWAAARKASVSEAATVA